MLGLRRSLSSLHFIVHFTHFFSHCVCTIIHSDHQTTITLVQFGSLAMGHDVIAAINYFNASTDGELPWFVASSIPTSERSNFLPPPAHITIHDLRGRESSVNLDKNGFEVAKYEGSIQEDFEEESEAQRIYFEEISNLLKKRLGASRVYICHHAFRSRNAVLADEQCNDSYRNPVFYPHVDADAATAETWVDDCLGEEESKEVRKKRFQMINVWRPLGTNPITHKPLTICDYSSIDIKNDIQPLTIRRTDHVATARTISPSAQNAHKWYYLSAMRPDEMFVFKNFDSKPDVAQFAVHTAFNNDHAPSSNLEEKSVELRCLAFFDEP